MICHNRALICCSIASNKALMKTSVRVELEDRVGIKDYILKIHRHIYHGQKQEGRVWTQYLVRKWVYELAYQYLENVCSTEVEHFIYTTKL